MVLKESISISRNPESIWSYWLDVSNDVYWRNGITRAEWTSLPPYGIGSTGEHTHKNMGAMTWEVSAFDEGNSFEFIHTAGPLKGSIALFEVKAEIKGSRVEVQLKISGSFIKHIMMFFLKNMMRKGVRGDLQKLKELLEN